MIFKKNLVLVGMMGSGKSTIGKVLSGKLKLSFIDTDSEIEKIENTSIKDIFEIKGEKYFRYLEEKIVLEKLVKGNKIISIGGGAFINLNVRNIVLKKNLSFWLHWNNETLINRLIKNRRRPLINNLSIGEIKNIIKNRLMFYKQANYKIDCENLTKYEIAEKIIKIYKDECNKS